MWKRSTCACIQQMAGREHLDYNCPEGDLEWVLIKELESLNLWEGDRVFFQLLQENRPFFSLKLEYDSDELIKCVLDGKELELTAF